MNWIKTFLVSLVLLCVVSSTYGLDIDEDFHSIALSKHMFILRDTASAYDINKFYDDLASLDFFETDLENFVENFGSEVYWLYIPIQYSGNERLETFLEIINPDLNEVKLYQFKNGILNYESETTGDKFLFETREIAYKNFVYPLDFDQSASEYEIILRINTAGEPFICPINLSSKESFYITTNRKNFGSGIYYCLLSIFIISLFIFYRISKEKMILFYIGYLVMLILYLLDIDGLTNQYLLSKYPIFQSLEQPVLAGLLSFFFLKFSNQFFNFKAENNSLYKLIKWTSNGILVLVIAMPLILNLPINQKNLILFIYLIVLLSSSVSIYLIVAIKSVKSRQPKYLLFAITFGLEAIGFCIHFLVTHAYLPDHNFTRNILFYASLISLSFFSIYLIYLIDRINANYKSLQLQFAEQKDKSFRNIMMGEEIERARISKILEDKIALRLQNSKKDIKKVAKGLSTQMNKSKLEKINGDIDLVLENLNSVNLNIAPTQLNKEGFKKTIERDLDTVADAFPKIKFEHIVDDIEAMGYSDFDKSVLYRIFEETLNNAIKHSQADNIEVQLLANDDELIYKIEDNGIGFQDPSGQFWGMGLKNIESRVSYLHGKFKIKSSPGKGTSMDVIIPIKRRLQVSNE